MFSDIKEMKTFNIPSSVWYILLQVHYVGKSLYISVIIML